MSVSSNLTVITGPSGVGKGTIVRKILESHSDVWLSISATTRKPRSGEIDGEHYFFLDKKNFKECTHKEGMAIASTTWAKKKAQILRKRNKIKKPVEEKGDE